MTFNNVSFLDLLCNVLYMISYVEAYIVVCGKSNFDLVPYCLTYSALKLPSIYLFILLNFSLSVLDKALKENDSFYTRQNLKYNHCDTIYIINSGKFD